MKKNSILAKLKQLNMKKLKKVILDDKKINKNKKI